LDTAAIRIAECLSHFLQKLAEGYEIWHRLSGFEPGEGVTKKKGKPDSARALNQNEALVAALSLNAANRAYT